MFRLLKLAAYGLLGYAIYEFVRGVMYGVERAESASANRGSRQGGQGQDLSGGGSSAGLSDQGARQNMTGPGEGRTVATQEADGGSVSHRVGRGVVSR